MLRAPLVALLTPLAALAHGCGLDDLASPTLPAPEAGPLHPVRVEVPTTLAGLATEQRDQRGRPVAVRCEVCHRTDGDRPLRLEPGTSAEVHSGLVFAHGELSCGSCHEPERPDRLRLADGRSVEMTDALRLCAQCHGPQARDWARGSHGGRRGYWDRRRGETLQSHCVACHDPHAPAFGSYLPAPPPRDRFLPGSAANARSRGGHDG